MNRGRSAVAAAAMCGLALAIAGCEGQVEVTKGLDDDNAAAAVAENATAPATAAASAAPLVRRPNDAALRWGPCPDIFPAGCEIAVLNGDPAQANADALLRVPGGYQIPPHSHTSAERMMLADGVMEVQYQGHPSAVLRAGSYAYGPAGLPHRATCRSSEPCVLFIAFVGPVDAKPHEGEL
jgi:quercetin dioxygenase-like cupin family protein